MEHTKELYKFDTSFFIPVKYKNTDVGWIHKNNNKILEFFDIRDGYIDAEDLKRISKDKKFYTITKIKNEYEFCPVFEQPSCSPNVNFDCKKIFGKDKLFDIERDLLAPLGLPQYGIHANGWYKEKSEFFFCFALRSSQIEHFPGLYDNIFAGGQPSAISIKQNLEKEAFEEAGIKILEKDLTIGNTFSYIHNHDHQIHSGTIFVYDYKIDQNIVLKNNDGEVQKFETICATEIDRILEKKLLKPNCIIPIADFFLRNMRDFFPNNSILELERVLKKK